MQAGHQSDPVNSKTRSLFSDLARSISAARLTGGALTIFKGSGRQPDKIAALATQRKRFLFTARLCHYRMRLSGLNQSAGNDGGHGAAFQRPFEKWTVRGFADAFVPRQFPLLIDVDHGD